MRTSPTLKPPWIPLVPVLSTGLPKNWCFVPWRKHAYDASPPEQTFSAPLMRSMSIPTPTLIRLRLPVDAVSPTHTELVQVSPSLHSLVSSQLASLSLLPRFAGGQPGSPSGQSSLGLH